MLGKYVISDGRINGILLLERKFPSLTARQISQLYGYMQARKLSLEDVKRINMLHPMAKLGESFGISVELNT